MLIYVYRFVYAGCDDVCICHIHILKLVSYHCMSCWHAYIFKHSGHRILIYRGNLEGQIIYGGEWCMMKFWHIIILYVFLRERGNFDILVALISTGH